MGASAGLPPACCRSAISTLDLMKSTAAHYEALYADLHHEFGVLDAETITGIIGFSAGGPVSMVQVPGKRAYVTCELSLYPEQVPSSEGERYELFCRLPVTESQAQALLTALGNLSQNARLGHGHTVDVSAAGEAGGVQVVTLRHYSSSMIADVAYGIYEVCAT
jgi:hypothetical protein